MVLLEEALEPGTTLFSENDIEKRLKVFCELFKSLHYDDGRSKESTHNSVATYQHQSYTDWITKITEYMESKSSWAEITTHMKRAKAWYMEILDQYPDQTLLHGDFHYYNILKTQKGYKIIDPKGVLGHPMFDIPRYVLNEYWDEKDALKVDATVEKVLTVLSNQLDISKGLLSRLMYIEGAMAMCWFVEDGMSIDDKESVLESIGQLYRYTI
jgi:streptomycin 6-kinase